MCSDIILVYPKTGFDVEKVSIMLPLSVLSAASCLIEEGFRVKIIDQRMDASWEKTLIDELRDNPLFVGVSSMTGTQIRYGLSASHIVREHSNIPVVWGGCHPSLLPEQTLEHPDVDVVVRGDGESALLELARTLDKGANFSGVRGLSYKTESGRQKKTPDRPVQPLSDLPRVPYELVDVKDYLRRGCDSFVYVSSRGCPFDCAYCSNPVLSGRNWRALEAEQVVSELQELRDKYSFKKLIFFDENFMVEKKRAKEIAEGIRGDFQWEIQARIDSASPVEYKRMMGHGLCGIQPGVESGSPRILEMINKRATVEKVISFNQKMEKTDVICTYNFMMGLPTETI